VSARHELLLCFCKVQPAKTRPRLDRRRVGNGDLASCRAAQLPAPSTLSTDMGAPRSYQLPTGDGRDQHLGLGPKRLSFDTHDGVYQPLGKLLALGIVEDAFEQSDLDQRHCFLLSGYGLTTQ
jgi:hypothetical protein